MQSRVKDLFQDDRRWDGFEIQARCAGIPRTRNRGITAPFVLVEMRQAGMGGALLDTSEEGFAFAAV